MDTTQNENMAKAVLKRLPPLDSSPYLTGRILALHRERGGYRRQLFWWRMTASVSLMALVVFFSASKIQKKTEPELFAFQPYVIRLNLNDNEVKLAASAEVELPSGVNFVSKNAEIRGLRRLKLPIAADLRDHNQLPFVVKSQTLGKVPLLVHLYDSSNNLLSTKTLSLNFVRPS